MNLSKHDFVYNAEAHFAAVEKFPDGLVKTLSKNNKESFEALCWTLAETAMQAELIRRDLGHDKKQPPTEAYFRTHLMPRDIREAHMLMFNAIQKGLRKDDEDEEVDEVLEEIEKKADGD